MRYFISGDKNSDRILLIMEGLVAGIPVSEVTIQKDIYDYQHSEARAKKSNQIQMTLSAGVRQGRTLGGPVALVITGVNKNALSSAYGTVAVGHICKSFLNNFRVHISSQCLNQSGIFQIIAKNIPPGLGSFVHYDRRLSAILCAGLMSLPGVKGVEVGKGFAMAECLGSQVHDEIFYNKKKVFFRKTNNAGGLEGGMTNGEALVLKVALSSKASLRVLLKKKIPTLKEKRLYLGESVVAYELACCFMQKFGGDSVQETLRNYRGYLEQVRRF